LFFTSAVYKSYPGKDASSAIFRALPVELKPAIQGLKLAKILQFFVAGKEK